MHPRGIADEVGLTVAEVRAALLKLEEPESDSRSPEEEGRRIIRMDEHRDWGWRVVNYLKYRAIRDEDDRREQNRLAQAAWRERNKSKPASSEISPGQVESAHTEAEAEVYTEEDNTVRSSLPVAQRQGAARGTKKAPKDWKPSEELLAWAAEEFPGVNPKLETEAMLDYTFARSIKDWDATWRNWIRKAAKQPPRYQGAEPMWRAEKRSREAAFAGRAAAKSQQPIKEIIDVPAEILG